MWEVISSGPFWWWVVILLLVSPGLFSFVSTVSLKIKEFRCVEGTRLYTHSSIEGHLRWFHSLAIVNCAALNTDVAVSL